MNAACSSGAEYLPISEGWAVLLPLLLLAALESLELIDIINYNKKGIRAFPAVYHIPRDVVVPLQFHTGVHEYQILLYNKCVYIKNAHIP
nr:MAG TPA: hypothetical protein [Caudoviricetes sp.]